MNHDDHEAHTTLISSYVLHALASDQQHEFEGHLATCESCRGEVAEFRDSLALLSETVATPPPPSLRASTLAAISDVRPLPPLSPPEPASAEWELAPVISLQARKTRRWQILAAAAAVVGVTLAGVSISSQLRLTQEQATHTQQEEQRVQQHAALLTAADLRVLASDLPGGGRVTYYLSAQLDRGMIVVTGLPELADQRAFQLWTFHDGKPVPNVVFTQSGSAQVMFEGGVRGAGALAMTVEAAGGSASPTTEPMGYVTVA